MLKLILSRSLQAVVVSLVVSGLTFALLAAAGGDALTALGDDPHVSEAALGNLRRVYGLDQPLAVRYGRWLADAARGRLGHSYFYQAPVESIIGPRFINTLMLAAAALAIAWAVALTLGVLAAGRIGGAFVNHLCEAIILLAASTPRLVLSLAVLALTARVSFSSGAGAPNGFFVGGTPAGLLLPAFVLCVPLVALFLAQVRDNLRAALRREFVRTARAKGLPERSVVLRHALRGALNPLITIFGLSLGGVLSGSVIVETVLDWPGVGQLSAVAVRSRDVPLLLGVVLVTTLAVLAGNLIADVLVCVNDPRLRRGASVDAAAASSTSVSDAASIL